MSIKKLVIDVSEYQGKIDWETAKHHIAGAILRCGYGTDRADQDDGQFKRNADECTRLGIPFGVYLYSYADSEERARSEAAHVLRLVKGYKLSYPIYYDLEETGTERFAPKAAKIFGDIIEGAGYWCGIYANLNWWDNYLTDVKAYTKWVAQYNDTCDYKGDNLDMWQYTSSGTIPGINGRCDANWVYRDFPAEIGGTLAPAPEPAKPAKPTKTLADYVRAHQAWLAGEYGLAVTSDGIWGPVTLEATTKAVQIEIDTISDGIWGPNSKDAMPVIEYGNTGNLVQAWQGLLTRFGYMLAGDGIWGDATEDATRDFQRKHGLNVDGMCGKDTMTAALK